jgi:hypothetical protein
MTGAIQSGAHLKNRTSKMPVLRRIGGLARPVFEMRPRNISNLIGCMIVYVMG